MRKRFLILTIFLFIIHLVIGQNNFWKDSDTLNKKRFYTVSAGTATVWAGSMTVLGSVWYNKADKSSFHFFNDFHEWLQMDKAGHMYTANKLSMLSGNLYKWSGLNNKTSAWLGFGVGMGYQTTLEILDGFNSKWGFSWSDMCANFIGSSSYLAQQLAWKEQRIWFKFSYHNTPYAALRPDVLGSNFKERLLKDYNGQTYWISFSPANLLKKNSFPKWICLSIGYSVDQKINGTENTFTYYSNNQSTTYYAKREWLLTLDIDFSRIPTQKIWLKKIFKTINYLKIPFPALMLSNKKVSTSLLYF